ncbi:hypothetical protein ISF_06527 [Cordyceps fumosorosea ARSEF 2679]|uniref:Uncharacterized protein n=1 Tax=Cordyceps fumosorosea (strain ARSEF 2679) TaxID=1081104 RepID=A0A167RMM3_CORFA|nr:hypothetical protein ISF_06527 [Cordyceps fumosorosea ARSEF 2679]OAA58744.1 hypothetical protein ISF_06527 [Cordyceps fumosorosea ARSEF 2679]
MAVAAVLAVPELHEAILLQIEMTTLLISAQRASRPSRGCLHIVIPGSLLPPERELATHARRAAVRPPARLLPQRRAPRGPLGDASPLRMCRLYDLVQERACRHESHCFWFRVHWAVMRGPASCEASQELGTLLFAQARVVVEFVEAKQPAATPKEPGDSDVFDGVFGALSTSQLKLYW